jgi:hypothetical protein
LARHQIICIVRLPRSEDPKRHISHVGLGTPDGWSRVLMAEEIIFQLKKEDGDRYFLRGRDGWEADVKLGKCPFCAETHEFLMSAPDLTAKDKLMTLATCAD